MSGFRRPGKYGFWGRGIVTERTVRPDGVILPLPPFCQDFSFYNRIEALTVERLIPELLFDERALVVRINLRMEVKNLLHY